jgi:hypothetical protein
MVNLGAFIMNTTYARRTAMLDPLLDRAAQDEQFRARLLRDTRGTLAATLSDILPHNVEVRVLEDEPNLRHIVVPYAERPVDEEIAALSELPDATPVVRELYTRAFRDADFRARLARNPRAVVEEVLKAAGQQPDAGVMFRALEETEEVRYIVLPPPMTSEAEDQLSDADLDLVAGGTTGGRAFSRIGYTSYDTSQSGLTSAAGNAMSPVGRVAPSFADIGRVAAC